MTLVKGNMQVLKKNQISFFFFFDSLNINIGYLSSYSSNNHLSSCGCTSLIKADWCIPTSGSKPGKLRRIALQMLFQFRFAAITIQHRVNLVPAVGVFVHLLPCMCMCLCVVNGASVNEGGSYCPRHSGSWKSVFDLLDT